MRTLLGLACVRALLLLALASSPVLADATPTIAAEPVETADGGFTLSVGKQIESRRSTSMQAFFVWGSTSEREATVTDAGSVWRVTFPDQPKPQEIAVVRFVYAFTTTDAEKAQIRASTGAIVEQVVNAVIAALNETQDPTALGEHIAAPTHELLKSLDRFRAEDGTLGSEVLLEALGLTRDDTGKIAPLDPAVSKLKSLDDALGQRAKAFGDSADGAQSTQPALRCQGKAVDWQATGAALEAVFSACRADLVAALQPIVDKAKEDKEALSKALEALKAAKLDSKSDPLAVLAGLQPFAGSVLGEPAYWGVAWAANRHRRQQIVDDALEPMVSALSHLIVELKQQEIGSVLIERSAEKRWWDVSTGVVYVFGLDDMVMPLLLAFCPADGCLRPGETFYSSPAAFGHSFSFDVGVRTNTLDTAMDPRHLDRPAFMVGVSWNPFYFLRGSFGMYMFDNALSHDWNQALYLGATINVLHTAQLLGVLGLGSTELKTKTEED